MNGRQTSNGVQPDFIGCKHFRASFDRSESARHKLVKLPRENRDADINRLNQWRERQILVKICLLPSLTLAIQGLHRSKTKL